MLADQAVSGGALIASLLGVTLALTPHHKPAACPEPIPVADLIVTPGATVVFGEIHGTREIPVAFGAIACHAAARAPLIVGLEMYDRCGIHEVGQGDDPGPTRITRDSVWNDAEEIVYQGHLHVGAVSASPPANNSLPET